MRYEMDFEVHSLPASGFMKAFQCGDSWDDRYPLIALPDDGDGWHIKFSTINAWNDPSDNRLGNDTIEAGQMYHIEIEISADWMKVEIDGVRIYSANKSRHEAQENQACWVGFDSVGANASISNILISNSTGTVRLSKPSFLSVVVSIF